MGVKRRVPVRESRAYLLNNTIPKSGSEVEQIVH
jgi:hypothetical protein